VSVGQRVDGKEEIREGGWKGKGGKGKGNGEGQERRARQGKESMGGEV